MAKRAQEEDRAQELSAEANKAEMQATEKSEKVSAARDDASRAVSARVTAEATASHEKDAAKQHK